MKRFSIFASSILLVSSLASADVTFDSFGIADADNDGKISKDEFYGFMSDAGIYADMDLDMDGFIDETEFDDLGLQDDYDTWDLDDDNYVGSDEFYDGYFSYFDQDEDDYWDDVEWEDAGNAGLFDV